MKINVGKNMIATVDGRAVNHGAYRLSSSDSAMVQLVRMYDAFLMPDGSLVASVYSLTKSERKAS